MSDIRQCVQQAGRCLPVVLSDGVMASTPLGFGVAYAAEGEGLGILNLQDLHGGSGKSHGGHCGVLLARMLRGTVMC